MIWFELVLVRSVKAVRVWQTDESMEAASVRAGEKSGHDTAPVSVSFDECCCCTAAAELTDAEWMALLLFSSETCSSSLAVRDRLQCESGCRATLLLSSSRS